MKKTIEDFLLKGKKVIIRVDYNVPIKDGSITDDTRIRASLKTVEYAISKGARVILMSHLGKVKDETDFKANDLSIVAVRLEELLGKKVFFSPVTHGVELENLIISLKDGDVLLMQNTRYEDAYGKRESSCDMELASYWASLGDIFINDAYGSSHRGHASVAGIPKFLPSGVGFLVLDEILALDGIMNEDTHPFIVMMGGAKVTDKILVIENLIKRCDKLLVGGAMAYTFLVASGYSVGGSFVDEEAIDFCKRMLSDYGDKIVLPVDHVVSSSNTSLDCSIKKIEDTDDSLIGFDIGPESISLFESYLQDAKRVVMNGPMGLFENSLYQNGTRSIYDFLVENNIKTLIGGGDSLASVHLLSDASKFYHISTGGGATLEYLAGKVLPGIEVIDEK